jgi:hypothetical protein
MQCGCPQCQTLMAQVEKGLDSACKCPDCGFECRACLGRQKGADKVLERGMSKDEWELILRLRKDSTERDEKVQY